jgi:serine protease Do
MSLTSLILLLGCATFSGRGWAAPITPPREESALTLPSFANLAEKVGPATVHIAALATPGWSTGLEQLYRDHAIRRGATDTQGRATGSGVIIRNTGLVLTNHHVVGGAREVQVTLFDRRTLPGRVLGSDPRTDVALVQIELPTDEKLPFAPLGDSQTLRIGDWVMAVGHPFDFQFTVTVGILSARGRRNLTTDEIADYLQTDAAINPGSSGGPLFNLAGEVVGINTAIFNPGATPQNAGIGFAIPAEMAGRIAEEILSGGKVARASLGLEGVDRPASPEHPRMGVEVTRLVPNGPAEQAGLRRGDVVVAVNGGFLSGLADLRAIVLATGIDRELVLQVERGEKILELRAKTRSTASPFTETPPEDGVVWAGMILAPPSETRLQALGVPPRGHPGALLVLSVTPGSPAGVAGIAPGDLLLEVLDSPIASAEALMQRVAGKRTATLGLLRGEARIYAVVAGLDTPP